jgi:hypothetical protein
LSVGGIEKQRAFGMLRHPIEDGYKVGTTTAVSREVNWNRSAIKGFVFLDAAHLGIALQDAQTARKNLPK